MYLLLEINNIKEKIWVVNQIEKEQRKVSDFINLLIHI